GQTTLDTTDQAADRRLPMGRPHHDAALRCQSVELFDPDLRRPGAEAAVDGFEAVGDGQYVTHGASQSRGSPGVDRRVSTALSAAAILSGRTRFGHRGPGAGSCHGAFGTLL